MKTLQDNEKLTPIEIEKKSKILASFASDREAIQKAYSEKQNSIRIANSHYRASINSIAKKATHHENSSDEIMLRDFEYDDLIVAYQTAINKACFDAGLPPHVFFNNGYPGYE